MRRALLALLGWMIVYVMLPFLVVVALVSPRFLQHLQDRTGVR